MSGERLVKGSSGWTMLITAIVLWLGGLAVFIFGLVEETVWMAVVGMLVVIVGVSIVLGLFINGPNLSRVIVLFGRYRGTVRENGFRWVNPFSQRVPVSLRIRTFDSDILKVNDATGNPVEIAAVINWQVVDTARAVFDVEDYERFVHVQAEAAIRHVASEYPYDHIEEGDLSLRANADDVTAISRRSSRPGSKRPESRYSIAGFDGWRMPPRLPGRCCAVNRQERWWPLASS